MVMCMVQVLMNAALKMTPVSWMNERLPEMLWAALIRVSIPTDRALELFRRFLMFVSKHPEKDKLSDLTLTGFSKLEQPLREEVIAYLVAPPEAAQALVTLRWFSDLPARDTWDKLLPATEPDVQLLMTAVGAHLWHQSQEATDCRWVRVMGMLVTGHLYLPIEMREIADEILGYPTKGDQHKVRRP